MRNNDDDPFVFSVSLNYVSLQVEILGQRQKILRPFPAGPRPATLHIPGLPQDVATGVITSDEPLFGRRSLR